MKEGTFNKYLKYVTLNIFAQIGYSCYTLFDTFFVAKKLRANGLTALNIAFPMFCLINGIGFLFAIGGAIKFRIYKNENKQEEANKVFTHSIYLALLISLVFIIIALMLSDKITILLGASEEIFPYAHTYLKTMMLFTPIFLINTILQTYVRNDNNPRLAMIALIAASLSNILLDYIFIFPLNMGIFGAILATGLSPLVSIFISLFHVYKKKNYFHLSLVKIDVYAIKDILKLGFPSFFNELTSGIIMLLFNYLILNIEGDIGVASFSVITVIALVIIALFNGLGQGIQPLISSYYADKKEEEIKKIMKYSFITSLLLGIIIYLILYFFAPSIVSIFNDDNNATLSSLAIKGIHLYFIAIFFIGMNMVSETYFASKEKALCSHLISLLRGLVVLVPTAIIMTNLAKIDGTFLSYPLSEGITFIIAVVLLIIHSKKVNINKKEINKTIKQ